MHIYFSKSKEQLLTQLDILIWKEDAQLIVALKQIHYMTAMWPAIGKL